MSQDDHHNPPVIIILSDSYRDGQFLIEKFTRERNILKCVEHSPELAIMIGNDPELYIAAIRFMDPEKIFLSNDIKSNRKVALFALNRNGILLSQLSQELKWDREITLTAIRNNPYAFNNADYLYKSDPEIVEMVLEYSLEFLKLSPLRNEKEFVMKAAERNGNILEFVGLNLREDKEIILKAVQQNGFALEYAKIIDKEIALAAVRQNGNAIEYAREFEYDEEVMKAAYGQSEFDSFYEEDLLLSRISNDPDCLLDEDISKRSDKDFMMRAVKANPKSYQYIWGDLKNDLELALEALSDSIEFLSDSIQILNYFDEKLRKSKHVIFRVAKIFTESLLNVDKDLMNDREFILELVGNVSGSAIYIPNEFKADRQIMLAAINKNFYSISYVDQQLFADLSFVEDAFDININTLGWIQVDKLYQENRDFILKLIRKNPQTLGFLINDMNRDREIIMEGIKQDGQLIRYAADELKDDKELSLIAVKQDGMAVKYLSKNMQKDWDVVWAAVHQCENAIDYVDESFRGDTDFLMKCTLSKVKQINQFVN